MIKQTITYTDFNNNEKTEDFYFNLTKAELLDVEYSRPGGFQSFVEKAMQSEDLPTILNAFKEIISRSYGQRSEDGSRFIKSAEISEQFITSEAYSELLIKMVNEEGFAEKFMSGIIPAKLQEVQNELSKVDTSSPNAGAYSTPGANHAPTPAKPFPDFPNATPQASDPLNAATIVAPTDVEEPKVYKDKTARELLEMSEDEWDKVVKDVSGGNWPNGLVQIAMRRASAGR